MDKIAPEFDRVAHQYPKQIYSISSLAGARDRIKRGDYSYNPALR
jgi:hypothetical protein